jgi:hypothetical protein
MGIGAEEKQGMARAIPRKSLTALKFLGVCGAVALTAAGAATIALSATGAYAMALNNAVRVSPAMNHVDGLGGHITPHTDRIFGPGGDSSHNDECYRRNYVRLEKLDTSKGAESIAERARRICGT